MNEMVPLEFGFSGIHDVEQNLNFAVTIKK